MITFKEIKSPLHLYDFFGYLLPGFLFFLLWFIELKYMWFEQYCDEWNCSYSEGILHLLSNDSMLPKTRIDEFFALDGKISFLAYISFVVICYLTGHIIAAFSSVLLEKIIVKRFFKLPDAHLFHKRKIEKLDSKFVFLRGWRMKAGVGRISLIRQVLWKPIRILFKSYIFKAYFDPFPLSFVKRFRVVINRRYGYQVHHSNYYYLALTDAVSRSVPAQARFTRDLNLYGFSRNLSIIFLGYACWKLWMFWQTENAFNFWPAIFYLVISGFLFGSYLKLFKRQTLEVFFHFISLNTIETYDSDPIEPRYTHTYTQSVL